VINLIIKHIPGYLGASSIAGIASLVMLKYYTAIFSPEEFGVLALYLVMLQYVMTLCSLGMNTSATRLYFDYKDTKKNEYLSTIFWFISGISILVFFSGMLFIGPISNWIAPDSSIIYIVTLFAGIAATYVGFMTRVLYNENKSKSVFKHSVFQTFVNHATSVLLISVFNLGIFGRISGQGLGYFLNIFTLFREFYKENLFSLKIYFSKKMATETFILAFPFMVASILAVAFAYLDRIFINYYMGHASVGIYTLGFMLGKGLSMLYEAIYQAILPTTYSDLKINYKKTILGLENFSFKYYIALFVISVVISLYSPELVDLLSNDSYAKSAEVIPFILAGFMMGGFYKIPTLILGYHKVVWFYPFASILAFSLNAFLNWILIPSYGLIGAAFSSFIGLFLYSAIIQIMSFKYVSSRYIKIITAAYLFIIAVGVKFFYE
jgi:O-antigen/teichoic acid export membrane protein